MTSDLTFRAIEKRLGIADEEFIPEESLGHWYESVRDKPICDLTVEDLARSCRQRLYLEYVVPVAIQRLEEDPLAGKKYDGELLVALKRIPPDYWNHNQQQAKRLQAIASRVGEHEDSDLRHDIEELLQQIASP